MPSFMKAAPLTDPPEYSCGGTKRHVNTSKTQVDVGRQMLQARPTGVVSRPSTAAATSDGAQQNKQTSPLRGLPLRHCRGVRLRNDVRP